MKSEFDAEECIMILEMVLTREEIEKSIPYKFVCTTRYGSIWNTMRREMRWNKEFSFAEQEMAEKLFRQSHVWFTKGIPDTVRMDFQTYELWHKIAKFCMSPENRV